jgi:hypothetical protein
VRLRVADVTRRRLATGRAGAAPGAGYESCVPLVG